MLTLPLKSLTHPTGYETLAAGDVGGQVLVMGAEPEAIVNEVGIFVGEHGLEGMLGFDRHSVSSSRWARCRMTAAGAS